MSSATKWSTVAIAVVLVILALGVAATSAGGDVPTASLDMSYGSSVPVTITGQQIDGLEITVQATTLQHPGALRLQVLELGTYAQNELGATVWKSAPGAPATAMLTIHLNRQPSAHTALHLRIAAESDTSVALLPGAAGSLTLVRATGCGAPLANSPTSTAIRARIAGLSRSVSLPVPPELAPVWEAIAAIADQDLQPTFENAVRAVRCVSPGSAPAHPEQVPAAQVKAWVTQVVLADGSPWTALRPLAAAIPADALRWAYLRMEELKRGDAAGTLQ